MAIRRTSRRNIHRELIARNKPPCHLCGEEIDWEADWKDPLAYQVDHVWPVSKGGPDELYLADGTPQKLASHRGCNREKSNKLPPARPRHFNTNRQW